MPVGTGGEVASETPIKSVPQRVLAVNLTLGDLVLGKLELPRSSRSLGPDKTACLTGRALRMAAQRSPGDSPPAGLERCRRWWPASRAAGEGW